jgi:hypothetical protein
VYKQLALTIIGTAPLVMHNGQTADPLNKYAKMLKGVSGKRKKPKPTMRNGSHRIFRRPLHGP